MNKIYIALGIVLFVVNLKGIDDPRNQEIAKLEDRIKEYSSKAEFLQEFVH
jgi:hypothetical protein